MLATTILKDSTLTKQLLTWAMFLAVTMNIRQSYAQTTSYTINEIRMEVEQINNDTGFTIITLNNEEFLQQMTDGGGDLRGYYKNGQLVKIIERIGLSSCVNITEYYFKKGKLIFVYTIGKEDLYVDSIGTFNPSIQNVTMECRFYFNNGTIVDKNLKGQTRCSGQLGKDWTIDFEAETTRYKKLLKK